MILCLCASPALDLTYRVDRLSVAGTNRVREVIQRPGGKAINVARLLHLLGDEVRLLTTAGGDTGAELVHGLRSCGVPHDVVPSGAPTRRTVAVVDAMSDQVTMLNEPATIGDWAGFVEASQQAMLAASVVVISGSLPSDAPGDGFAALIRYAGAHDTPVVLDTGGPALLAALAARPTVVKPNAAELQEGTDHADPLTAARELADRWQVRVVASLGAEGLVAVYPDKAWRARPGVVVTGNPTGAGDAVVAGLARGLASGATPEATLADCIALATAAVLAPTAGELDLVDYERHRSSVVVEAMDRVRG
jgi:tagatose 6-phosphate kinase